MAGGDEPVFTGIIEDVGTIERVERTGSGARFFVRTALAPAGVEVGGSIAVSGPCLTLSAWRGPVFEAEAVHETLARTTLARASAGIRVNLERPLTLEKPLGGHLVLGHVDGTGRLLEVKRRGDAVVHRLAAPPEVMRYAVFKGSIAVDGASLTVSDLGAEWLEVSLIRHTLEHTTLGDAAVGRELNLEADIIGKYVEKLWGGPGELKNARHRNTIITKDFLFEHGFGR